MHTKEMSGALLSFSADFEMPTAHRIPKASPVYSFLAGLDPKVDIYVTHIDTSSATHRK